MKDILIKSSYTEHICGVDSYTSQIVIRRYLAGKDEVWSIRCQTIIDLMLAGF